MCKTLGDRAVRQVVDLAIVACRGAAFFRAHPLERLWRDVQAVRFHPLPEKPQQRFTGRLALGLPVA